jgi:hypothetical protein
MPYGTMRVGWMTDSATVLLDTILGMILSYLLPDCFVPRW